MVDWVACGIHQDFGDLASRSHGIDRVNELYDLGVRRVTEERIMEEVSHFFKEIDLCSWSILPCEINHISRMWCGVMIIMNRLKSL